MVSLSYRIYFYWPRTEIKFLARSCGELSSISVAWRARSSSISSWEGREDKIASATSPLHASGCRYFCEETPGGLRSPSGVRRRPALVSCLSFPSRFSSFPTFFARIYLNSHLSSFGHYAPYPAATSLQGSPSVQRNSPRVRKKRCSAAQSTAVAALASRRCCNSLWQTLGGSAHAEPLRTRAGWSTLRFSERLVCWLLRAPGCSCHKAERAATVRTFSAPAASPVGFKGA